MITIKDIIVGLQHYIASDENERKMVNNTIAFAQTYPDCLLRSLLTGHLTASAWITDESRKYVLLIHHYKLDKWFQLGGHADGEPDLRKVALTEAREESGLQHFSLISEVIFDVDIHQIPARLQEPAHYHYDIRFLLQASRNEPLVKNAESKALEWVSIEQVSTLNNSESIQRMVRKHMQLFS
ncbi:NUDIX hydrolase [Rhodocytophaga rosea]|uniref:NUDIX hydrolase n=1 Tax=Rhodocytophaga rosea TaxID=2704465 RepID=A0A6C0GKK5_9BACT|nr:NUDIX hydrolase [Rhodocytophaga rosea]QHT68499.1 NUDIX hydrolase [Rhodocytophaga rosea]